jgi:hypothetical protein
LCIYSGILYRYNQEYGFYAYISGFRWGKTVKMFGADFGEFRAIYRDLELAPWIIFDIVLSI